MLRSGPRPIPCLLLALVLGPAALASAGAEELGLRLPPGFRVTVFADETLANDTYAMTLDARGRVVVTTQGSVRTLHDDRGEGKASRATVFATTGTGGMGLCFDGNDLLFCGDGWLSRYRDRDGDGAADVPPERLVPLAFAEHGGHAMRKGPDGFWYVVGGNDSGIGTRHAEAPDSPIRAPEAGALLRLDPDGRHCAVIAQGFRNPYDFDFNPAGDLFTYDSDCERDAFLPWYTPTRIYHVAYAGHHGWRLKSYLRSWCRRDDYLDTVSILWPVGRGSPTGVVCYRHDQFPEPYRGAVFALDWTFGKVYVIRLEPDGATYRPHAEVFIEPLGTQGFAPTDAVVAPDGALLVSIGGRKTRGAVYRIEYVGDGKGSKPSSGQAAAPLDVVLRAPQPLDAWSRARWVPVAQKLGADPFAAAVGDPARSAADRVRAVEVLTELFGGIPAEAARAGAEASSPTVRARVAWSLGRVVRTDSEHLLLKLAGDADPRVRVCALDALADRLDAVGAEPVREVLGSNLEQPEKRVRQAAARLAARLPEASWTRLARDTHRAEPRARLTLALAALWRDRKANQLAAIDEVLDALRATQDPGLRLDAVRLIVLALGDYHLIDPPVEIDTGYSLAEPLAGREALVRRIADAVRPLLPSGHERLDEEAARLLAMLEDDDPNLPATVATFWTETSSATRDLHFLIVFSRLRGPHGGRLTPLVARTVLALDRKLGGKEQRVKQTWNDRLVEIVTRLVGWDPALADALVADPSFPRPAHVPLAACLPPARRDRAARLFLDAVQADPEFEWSGTLIDLLTRLPASEIRPVFRAQWADLTVREPILLALADSPEEQDRGKFLTGLESSQPQVVGASLAALERLPRDETAAGLVPVLRLLRRSFLEPREATLRRRALALIARQAGRDFDVREGGTTPLDLTRAYRPVFEWFEHAHPDALAALEAAGEGDPASLRARLQKVDWSQGDPTRGEVLFRARACQTCHAGPRALGPDLTGVTGRFAREDLFNAIAFPSRDVAPAYRTTLVETRDGQVLSGMVAFESADGLILQTGATTTVRVPTSDIAVRTIGTRSLMPSGLLDGLSDRDLADLDSYLRTLLPPSPPRREHSGSPRPSGGS